MFYPSQLLVHPQKTELSAAWFAATLSKSVFKKRYKYGTINKINITKLCEEIQEIACNKNKNGIKFSLYLLSQLMCGITKLHLYQTTYYEKYLYDIQKRFEPTEERKEQPFDVIEDFDIDDDPLNVSLMKEANLRLDENLLLSQHQNLENGLQIIRTAAVGQDFGALIDKELNFMCEPNTMLMEKRLWITPYSKERDGTEIIEDVEMTEEVHQERYSPMTIPGPALVNVPETNAKLPSTPQKRESQDQSQVDTPTKRRRLSFKEMVVPLTEGVTLEEIRAPISQQVESDVELQSLESFFAKEKSKKTTDKKSTLNDELCKKWCRNVNIWCRQSEIVQVHVTPVENLLTQPSHKKCAARLRLLFNNHFITRPSSADENIVSTEPIQPEEPLRAEESTRLNVELSGLGKSTMIMNDGSTVVHEVSAMPPPEMTAPDMITAAEGITKDITKHEENKIRNINELNETLEDITILLERQQLRTDFILESTMHSSRTSQTIPLTHHEILAMLETLWCDKEYIQFDELMPDTYSAKDKIKAFMLLLALHAQQKVVLTQKDFYDILYICKYDNYSDDSQLSDNSMMQ